MEDQISDKIKIQKLNFIEKKYKYSINKIE